MSYNTRRGGGYGTPASAVGQRRPGNYNPGTPQVNQQQKPMQQTPNRNQPQPQQQTPQQRMQQAQLQKTPQQQVQPQPKPVQQPPKPVQQPITPQAQKPPFQQQTQPSPQQQKPPQQAAPAPVKQEPKIVFANKTDEQTMEVETVDEGAENGGENGQEGKTKRVLFFRTGKGKISKKERLRKRNQRLRKLLQPKNAPMVLNELVGSVTYNIIEAPTGFTDEGSFKAVVVVDELEHSGFGKSKALAKSSAAEAAIKHLVLKKVTSGALAVATTQNNSAENSVDGEEDAKMEVVPDEDDSFSWSHVASFALHKLFNSWDDPNAEKMGPKAVQNIINRATAMSGVSPSPGTLARLVANPHSVEQKPEHKPAKKLPDNANEMNPIMLLNQMRPGSYYEEVCKSGNPPNVKFTFRCIVDGQNFSGTGTSKKVARKHAAYAACQAVLEINYPQEVLLEIAQQS